MNARIMGIGRHVPERIVTNDDLAQLMDTTDAWIQQRTGIRQRHFISSDAGPGDLAQPAAREALADAGIDAKDLDLVILGSLSPDFDFPGGSSVLMRHLGIRGVPGMDVRNQCSAFIYMLAIADKFIRSGSHKKALIIGTEVFSRILDWSDRGTCVLFGDGAGAVVLEASDTPGILATALHADGSQSGILNVPGQVCGGQITGDPFLRMDGPAVFKFAVRVLVEVAEEVCKVAGIGTSEVDWLIPHQANIRIIDATGRKLGVDRSKVIVTVDRHGNTSAASVPLALDEAVRDGRIQRGQQILLEGVGGGFTWGAALLVF